MLNGIAHKKFPPEPTRGGAVPSEANVVLRICLGQVGNFPVVSANLVHVFEFEVVSSVANHP